MANSDMPLVALTRLRLRSWRYLPQFAWYAIRSDREARKSRGCLEVKLLKDSSQTFWTASLWQDEAAMRAFMIGGAHGKAMPKLRIWCDEASIAQWQQSEASLPDWQQAHRRMLKNGRRSRVDNPSAAHIAFEIPKPTT